MSSSHRVGVSGSGCTRFRNASHPRKEDGMGQLNRVDTRKGSRYETGYMC